VNTVVYTPPVVGFTATRRELTPTEVRWVRQLLTEYFRPGAQFHHGDCRGGDEFGHFVASELGYYTVSHPPTDPRLRAFTRNDLELPALPYVERNKQIVYSCTVLIGVPATNETNGNRSGTWQTIRFARDVAKGRVIRNWELEKDRWLRDTRVT